MGQSLIYQIDLEYNERIDEAIENDEFNMGNLLDQEEYGNDFQDQEPDEDEY